MNIPEKETKKASEGLGTTWGTNPPLNVEAGGGGALHVMGVFDFNEIHWSEDFWIFIDPTQGLKKTCKLVV